MATELVREPALMVQATIVRPKDIESAKEGERGREVQKGGMGGRARKREGRREGEREERETQEQHQRWRGTQLDTNVLRDPSVAGPGCAPYPVIPGSGHRLGPRKTRVPSMPQNIRVRGIPRSRAHPVYLMLRLHNTLFDIVEVWSIRKLLWIALIFQAGAVGDGPGCSFGRSSVCNQHLFLDFGSHI